MQTTLLGLAIAFILALVAALVGPYFIDWNQFRPQFEAEATRVIGAPVRVGGGLEARLLPAPALRLQSITVGSPNDLGRIRADNLSVEFSLSSLMRGEWRATELTIGGAAVDLGLNAQGRIELPASTGPFNLGGLAIDRLNVTGRMALHDAASRNTLELFDVVFSGDVRSLAAGAMRGDGNFLLSGVRYPFRLSSGQTGDGNGTRVRFTVDPGEKPLSVDLDGVLNFDNRMPRFDGALTLASPAGLKASGANDQLPTPWRLFAKVKADPAAAHMETLEASYGAEETAFRFTGLADMRFGASPLLHAVLSAKQLDADRLLSRDQATNDVVTPLPALRRLLSSMPMAPLATQIEMGVEQIMLGGKPVQNIGADLRSDAATWTVDRLEFRAPGATRVTLSGGAAQPGVSDGFKGAIAVESSDPDTLAAWLKGRTDIGLRNQKPLRIRGNVTSASNRLVIEALKAEIDGGTVQGHAAYSYPSAAGGSRFDADLKADRLDLDAAVALIRSLGEPQAEWPDAGQVSLDIVRAVSAGQEMRPFVAQLAYSPKTISVDRFKVGDAASLMLDGRASFDRVEATGGLTLNATSASMSQISNMLAPLAPSVASRLNSMTATPGAVRVKLSLDLAKDQQRADRTNARVVFDIDAPLVKGMTTLTASPPIAAMRGVDLTELSRSDVALESKLAGQGGPLLALLGLSNVIAASDAIVNFEGSAKGQWRAPLRVTAKLSGADIDADVQGSVEPWAGSPKASLALAIRRANLAPLVALKPSDAAAQNVSLSSRLTLNGDKVALEDIDSSLAGSHVRGRIALTLGAEKLIDGQIGIDAIELGPAFGLAVGTRGRDVTDPIGRGVLQGWRGQLAFQALSGTLPGGIELRPVSGIVKSDGQALTIDTIKGVVGGGEITADVDLKPSVAGYTLGARVQFSGVDGAALRYRSLAMPAGKTSLRMALASQGRSVSALEGAMSGSGLLTIDAARINGLDPRAFDAAIRASDSGQATNDAKLRQIVDTAITAGTLSVTAVQVPFSIKDSRLRIGATTLDGEGGRAIVSGGYDIVADQVDMRATLTGTTVGTSSVRPEVQIFVVGTPDKFDRTLDVAALSSWLAVRAIDRETRRLDSLERGELPPTAVPVAVPPPSALPVDTQAPASDPPTASAPSDVLLPARDPRRPAAKAAAPRSAVPPVASQQVAPLPAPIEVRPAPGAARAPRPRPAPPLVLIPPAASSARPTF
ncbi:AsmA-like C-terminal region-containing protein [Tardiphaga sp.]|uniref:AsmA family protein n=1 Tax=Tardiphaga sp. TaxID=1926292 RepID=UPI00352B3277